MQVNVWTVVWIGMGLMWVYYIGGGGGGGNSTSSSYSVSTVLVISPANADDNDDQSSSSVFTQVHPTSSSSFTNYPTWDAPSRANRSVVSVFGDFEWAYPDARSKEAYMRERYTANELRKCDPATTTKLCCEIGTSTGKAHHASASQCRKHMDLMAEFYPIPRRPLVSLVSALLALHQAHPTRTEFEMLFIGDSVTGQVFHAALCELARSSQVKSLTFNSVQQSAAVNYTSLDTSLGFQESHVKLHAAASGEVDFTLLFVRQFQLSRNAKAVRAFLHRADVAVFGWGLHYEKKMQRLPGALNLLVTALEEKKTTTTLIWTGTPHQHFRYDLNNTQVDGVHSFATATKHAVRFCGPTARFPPGDVKAHGAVNQRVFDYLNRKQSAQWFMWNSSTSATSTHPNGMLHFNFVRWHELSAPFYRNHRSYHADQQRAAIDCTHSCYAGFMYLPVWDAIGVILRRRLPGRDSDDKHTTTLAVQLPPPLVDWTAPLHYEAIEDMLRGEVL